MCQSVSPTSRETQVTFSLHFKTVQTHPLADLIDEGELREQGWIPHSRSLSLSHAVKSTWLRGNTFYGKTPRCSAPISWMASKGAPAGPTTLNARANRIRADIRRVVALVMLWENSPALAGIDGKTALCTGY